MEQSGTSNLQEAKDEEVTDSMNIGMMYFKRFTYSQTTYPYLPSPALLHVFL